MKPASFLTAALACSSLSAAWPSVEDFKAVGIQQLDNFLGRRQNGGGNNNDNNDNSSNSSQGSNAPASNTQQQSVDQSSNTAQPTITDAPQSSGGSNNNDNASSGGDNNSGTITSRASTTRLSPIDPNVAAGVNMISPPVISGVPIYKIGNNITWQWNYTGIARPPQAVDIVATYSNTGKLGIQTPFTIALNQSYQTSTSFIWDTNSYSSSVGPLPEGTYALIVYDAASTAGVSATAAAGHLGASSNFRFGMYIPGGNDTTGAPGQTCLTCNSASSMERMTVTAILGTAALTVGSCMWFAGGWGVLM